MYETEDSISSLRATLHSPTIQNETRTELLKLFPVGMDDLNPEPTSS